MLYFVEEPELLKPNMWAGKIAPMYLDHLKDGFTPIGPYSVIAARIQRQGDGLAFDPTHAQLFCRGVSEEAIFLNSVSSEHSDETLQVPTIGALRGESDEHFLAACGQLVGEEFAKLAEILLRKIRRTHEGRLIEGKGRKWLNHPDNFMAITIQNRDRSLAISIRDVVEAHDSELRPKPDRPGYLRFKISKPADIGEAVRLVNASAWRS